MFRIVTQIICLYFLIQLVYSKLKMNKKADKFELGDKAFLLNGKPFQIISGEMHYPRIPREAWEHRMKMARAMGLNTISIYIFWNAHQPQKDHFDFTGNNDISQFVKTAQDAGLFVILRPSPYVCAEWEFGGYPYWLQNEKDLEVRSKNENYLTLYRNYIQQVANQIAHFQINRGNGGNIIMIQVENEYGSYGSDKEYLEINKKIFNEAGFDGILFTCDPKEAIVNGHLNGLLPAINGVDDPQEVFRLVSENNNGKGPFLIAEWYPAWFDNWGLEHHTKDASEYADKLDQVLKHGISINMYMFHGGTTFGYRNGANYGLTNPGFEPQITSYDYDAPVNEAGNPTEKFYKFREVIKKYLPQGSVLPDLPTKKSVIGISNFNVESKVNLLTNLNNFQKYKNKSLLTFEDINLDYGYILYRTQVKLNPENLLNTFYLQIDKVRDYAVVMVNGERIGKLDRRLNEKDLSFSLSTNHNNFNTEFLTLDILVENMGRINFGEELLKNKKGILGDVKLNNLILDDWEMYKLSLDSIKNVKLVNVFNEKDDVNKSPMIFKGTFYVEDIGDTYLDLTTWGKGGVWINGRNIGRYWFIGPQQTLYVPKEWLKKGKNEFVIFETLKSDLNNLKTLTKPLLDKLQ